MSLLRCLHPPGGAAALTAVIGGPAVLGAGYAFPFVPVGINSLILILTGIAFHRASGHSYPHRPIPISGHELAVSGLGMPHPEVIDLALADLGETFDVSRDDLDLLFRRVEFHTSTRATGPTPQRAQHISAGGQLVLGPACDLNFRALRSVQHNDLIKNTSLIN